MVHLSLAFVRQHWPQAEIYRAIYLAALEHWVNYVISLPELEKIDDIVIYIAGHQSRAPA